MTWIEGIGDEVTLFFILLLVGLIGIIAWVSTSISDQPHIRTVLILERRSVHRHSTEPVESSTVPSVSASTDTGQPDTGTDREGLRNAYLPCDANNIQTLNETTWELPNNHATTEVPDEQIHVASSDYEQTTPEERSNDNIVKSEVEVEQESCTLRARRVTFFNNRQATLLEEPVHSEHVQSEEEINSPLTAGIGNIRIRLKYLNDDQKMVEGKLEEQLGDFKRRHFSPELSADKLVRLIFNGHVLQSDSETLEGCGLFDNCVVHCLVHQQRTSPINQSDASAGRDGTTASTTDGVHIRDWDMGNILVVSLSLVLGVAWYCRFLYAQLFNATTTVALAGLTGILAISLVGIYFSDQDFPVCCSIAIFMDHCKLSVISQ